MTDIEKKLSEITNAIKTNTCENSSLLSGQAGIALFLAYVNKHYNDPALNEDMEAALHKSMSVFEREDAIHTFGGGFAGVCWTVNHLILNNSIDADPDTLFSEIDPFLVSSSENDLKINFFDVLHGGLGAGIYFLDRLSQGSAKEHVANTIEFLHKHAIISGEDIMWTNIHIRINEKSEKQEYNLGLSHGIPSIVWFLCKSYEAGIEKEKCKLLVTGAVEWILKQQLPETSNSKFPIAVEDTTPLGASRLGWCYGDMGIASAILQAGKAFNNEGWKNEAISTMLHASKRRGAKENNVIDAGLCHGTAGIGHIFNRFYRETKNPVFKETADYWMNETLKMAYHEDGLAGYKSADGKGKWIIEEGLLEGAAGIGLALHAHITDEEPCWDRCLLLS